MNGEVVVKNKRQVRHLSVLLLLVLMSMMVRVRAEQMQHNKLQGQQQPHRRQVPILRWSHRIQRTRQTVSTQRQHIIHTAIIARTLTNMSILVPLPIPIPKPIPDINTKTNPISIPTPMSTTETPMPLNTSILLTIIHPTLNNNIYLMFNNRLVTSINIHTHILILPLPLHISSNSTIITHSHPPVQVALRAETQAWI